MLSERILTKVVETMTNGYLRLSPTCETHVCGPDANKRYMLYMHIPFCEKLCPYCSFNRFPFSKEKAVSYFANLRREMLMLKDIGYDFESVYIGGGTPTIMLDELCQTIDLARDTFNIKEVSCETNPNHLTPEYISQMEGRIQRLSVGVQSFDDGLLRQMDRYDKYGSGREIEERIAAASSHFISMNADMIFNFPAQTEDILISDIERAIASGATQVTFYPLMASPSVQKSLRETVGSVDYAREKLYYEIICELMLGSGVYELGSAWTFNKTAPHLSENVSSSEELSPSNKVALGELSSEADTANNSAMIDEYVVDFEEYPAIGSGGITYLGNNLYVNTFSLSEYKDAIESGRMSLMGKTTFSLRDRMRYRFMMQLFGLRLDKKKFQRDFGMSIERGLPAEMAFMRASGAFDIDDEEQLTLTSKGRYLTVVMMRQFFIGVNSLRDQARAALPKDERELLFK